MALDGAIARSYVDHLHGYIELDEQTTNLIHRPEFRPEVARLGELSQLSIVPKVHRLARHSKWEHSIGVYHLASRFLSVSGLSTSRLGASRESFLAAAILHGIGHFPLSYPTELAVAAVIEIYPAACGPLLEDFRRVERMICGGCTRGCWERVIRERRVTELVWWLSASKILRARGWFNRQSTFNHHDIVRSLVCSRETCSRLLRDLDLLDFVQRDLFHTAVARLGVNSDHLFARASVECDDIGPKVVFPPEWSFITNLHDYLIANLYYDPNVAAAEAVWAKAVVLGALSGRLPLEELGRLTDDEAVPLVDKRCRGHLGRFAKVSDVMEAASRGEFQRPIETMWITVDAGESPLSVEATALGLTAEDWGRLDLGRGVHVIVRPPADEEGLAAADLVCDGEDLDARVFLRAAGRLSAISFQTGRDNRASIMSWLFGQPARIDWSKYVTIASSALRDYAERKIADTYRHDIEQYIEDSDLAGWLQYDRMRTAGSLSDDELWARIAELCIRYAGDLVREVRRAMISQLPERQGDALELKSYLRRSGMKPGAGHFRWSMPSLLLGSTAAARASEVDGVTVEVGQRGPAKVHLYMHTISPSTVKAGRDANALRAARDLLVRRFGKTITVLSYLNDIPLP